LKVTGNLTVRETTRQITFDVITRLEGTTLSGSAETTILLSDFNVGPISIAGVLQTEDQARIILQFVARP
jgi:polyisoprenoid-binding protein YceI